MLFGYEQKWLQGPWRMVSLSGRTQAGPASPLRGSSPGPPPRSEPGPQRFAAGADCGGPIAASRLLESFSFITVVETCWDHRPHSIPITWKAPLTGTAVPAEPSRSC